MLSKLKRQIDMVCVSSPPRNIKEVAEIFFCTDISLQQTLPYQNGLTHIQEHVLSRYEGFPKNVFAYASNQGTHSFHIRMVLLEFTGGCWVPHFIKRRRRNASFYGSTSCLTQCDQDSSCSSHHVCPPWWAVSLLRLSAKANTSSFVRYLVKATTTKVTNVAWPTMILARLVLLVYLQKYTSQLNIKSLIF